MGFRHGLNDAVNWEVWQDIAGGVVAGGGRWAVALPGNIWVLDIDNPAAWREFVRLVNAGGLEWDRVLGCARTRRGWHIWVQMDYYWRMRQALSILNTENGWGCEYLEVKTSGGYVVWPDGEERRWVPREMLQAAVARASALAVGWGSRWVRGLDPMKDRLVWGLPLGSREPPALPQHYESFTAEEFPEAWGPEEHLKLLTAASERLKKQAGRLSRCGEGKRNNALNRTAYIEGQDALVSGMGRAEVEEILMTAAKTAGLTTGESRATIKSGLDAVKA